MSERTLWAEVVSQALLDVRDEPIDSVLFAEARSFFVANGAWADGRRNVADMLDVHPDDLTRIGTRAINARLLREGLPPLPTRPATSRSPTQRVPPPASRPAPPPAWPKLVAIPAPEPKRQRGGGRHWSQRYALNPFDPWARLPSELRKAG